MQNSAGGKYPRFPLNTKIFSPNHQTARKSQGKTPNSVNWAKIDENSNETEARKISDGISKNAIGKSTKLQRQT